MRKIRFYQESNRWYADLPEWKGEQWELEMVSGADTMLDIYAQGESEVHLTLSTEKIFNSDCIKLESFDNEGAWYTTNKLNNVEYPGFRLWLCHVTKFVFGNFPNKIYIK